MKKKETKEIKEKKNKKDNSKVEIIEAENFNFSKTGSLAKDLKKFDKITKLKSEQKEVPEIELQKIVIRETGNFLNLQENYINIPIEMIIFPFFTPQKQNKRINFEYTFEDLGVKMSSTLIVKDINDKIFQPSIFEEKIYLFLISMYQNMCEQDNSKLNEDEAVIEFEISDFIVKFLGNKMNRVYYSKVEQALKNLKNTQYQFEISNYNKFGKNEFEDKEFKLLTYQKLKSGKKIHYKVFLNKNIIKKIKEKRYIKYNTKTLVELMSEDPIASRIYRYISKERYGDSTGVINIRTLAAIIPLKIEQKTTRETKKGTKTYILNRMKPVLNRILKAFNVLLKLKYLKKFEEEYDKKEDTYYITYMFNKERDGDCHFSEYVKKSDKNIKREVSEDFYEEKIYSPDVEFEPIDDIKYLIKKFKKIYLSYWNKRVDTKLDKVLKEEGEVKLKRLLNIFISDEIKIEKSLVRSINEILKGLKKKKNTNKNMSIFGNVVKEKGVRTKNQINKIRKRKMEGFEEIATIRKENKQNKVKTQKLDNFEKILKKFDELTQIEIEKKALEIFEKEGGEKAFILEHKKISEKTYYKMMAFYIMKVIEEEYKDVAETNDNK
ncbi:MAG: chromosomal replication initiator DnaA [Fusobacteriales bacterium]|nr:MAG: chromosomal replication initiator DnaA [Fusobacteriales bacterium]